MWIALAAALALADEPTESWQRTGYGWGALPAVNYNSDEGFGFGVVGSVYRYDGETQPYRWSLGGQIFTTTLGVHYHRLSADVLGLAGGKLRLDGRVQLSASRAANYCGLGGDVACDPAEAEQAMPDGLSEEEQETFLRRYHLMRYVMPYSVINARYKLSDKPHRVELFGGLRAVVHRPGDLGVSAPYPGTLYAEKHPDGESGFLGVVQLGLMGDNRDNEPAPTRGYWIEGSVRGAGGSWGYVGGNVTARGYVPLLASGDLVLASRTVLDGIGGDAPTVELGWLGGSQVYTAFGGGRAGRGIRAERFRGRVKIFEQAELRWTFAHLDVGFPLDLTVLAYVDAGHVAEDWSDLGTSGVALGQGGGLRVAIDDNFIVRVDLATSAVEDWGTGLYIDLDNLF